MGWELQVGGVQSTWCGAPAPHRAEQRGGDTHPGAGWWVPQCLQCPQTLWGGLPPPAAMSCWVSSSDRDMVTCCFLSQDGVMETWTRGGSGTWDHGDTQRSHCPLGWEGSDGEKEMRDVTWSKQKGEKPRRV